MQQELLKYSEKEQRRLEKAMFRKLGFKVMAKMEHIEYPNSPLVNVINDEGEALTTSGLSKHDFRNTLLSGQIELIVNLAGDPDNKINYQDIETIATQMIELCNQITDKSFLNNEDCCFTLNNEFKKRFGYGHAVLLGSGLTLKVRRLGIISFMLVVPLYEDEYNYYKEYCDDIRRLNMMIGDIERIYSENDKPFLAIDVKREQLSYV